MPIRPRSRLSTPSSGPTSYCNWRSVHCLDLAELLDTERVVPVAIFLRGRAARLNLPSMRYPPERRVEVYARAVRGLSTLEPDRDRQLEYLEFVDIYTQLDDDERRRYQQDYPEEMVIMNTFAERFIEQGMKQGEAAMLLLLIEHKFGPPDDAVRERIENADADTLLRWSERILSAERVEEVFS